MGFVGPIIFIQMQEEECGLFHDLQNSSTALMRPLQGIYAGFKRCKSLSRHFRNNALTRQGGKTGTSWKACGVYSPAGRGRMPLSCACNTVLRSQLSPGYSVLMLHWDRHTTHTHISHLFKTKVIIRVMIKCVINLIFYCCLYSPFLSHVSFYPD